MIKLIALLKQEGEKHSQCFQFTVLEVCDINASNYDETNGVTSPKKDL